MDRRNGTNTQEEVEVDGWPNYIRTGGNGVRNRCHQIRSLKRITNFNTN